MERLWPDTRSTQNLVQADSRKHLAKTRIISDRRECGIDSHVDAVERPELENLLQLIESSVMIADLHAENGSVISVLNERQPARCSREQRIYQPLDASGAISFVQAVFVIVAGIDR